MQDMALRPRSLSRPRPPTRPPITKWAMVGRLGLRTEVFLNRNEPSTKQFLSIGAAAVESCRWKIRFATGKGLSVSAALALLAGPSWSCNTFSFASCQSFFEKLVGSTNQPLQSLMSKKLCAVKIFPLGRFDCPATTFNTSALTVALSVFTSNHFCVQYCSYCFHRIYFRDFFTLVKIWSQLQISKSVTKRQFGCSPPQ